MKMIFSLLPMLALCVPVFGITPDQLSAMVPRSPDPVAGTLRGVVFHNGKGVAVGDRGMVISSDDDGETWKQEAVIVLDIPQKTRPSLTGIATDGTRWVASSFDRQIAVSTDLRTWESLSLSITARSGVYFGNGRFVAVGQQAKPAWSTDGETWQVETALEGTSFIGDMTFGNGLFVAISTSAFYTSSDGETWTRSEPDLGANPVLRSVKWVNGQFIAVGDQGLIVTSPNGMNWTKREGAPVENFNAVAYESATSEYLLLDRSRFVTSTANFVNYGTRTTIPGSMVFDYLEETPSGEVVGIGRDGAIGKREEGVWQEYSERRGRRFGSIAFMNSFFATNDVLEKVMLTSPDGQRWTQVISWSGNQTTDVVTDGSIFAMLTSEGTVVKGDDLWSESATDLTFIPLQLKFLEGRWVAVGGSGQVAESQDLLSWDEFLVRDAAKLNDINFGEGVYVVVGSDSSGPLVFSSPDLENWTEREVVGSTAFLNYKAVEFGNGRFMIFPFSGVPALSEDGVTWNQLTVQNSVPSEGTGYDEGLGFYSLNRFGNVDYFEADAALDDRFRRVLTQDNMDMSGIAEGNGFVVGVGDRGLILSTPYRNSDYEAWILEHFGEDQLDFRVGITRDPDGDGSINIEEYLRGTDPLAYDPPLQITVNQVNGQASVIFQRRNDRDDVSIELEYSTDLENWETSGQDRERTDLGNGMELLRLTLPGEPGRQEDLYLRLRYTLITSGLGA